MNKEILILTMLPEVGTTGVQSHFNLLSDFLKQYNIKNKILTPYTYKAPLIYRILGKLNNIVLRKFDLEQSIIFSREMRLRVLRKNMIRYLKNNKSDFYYIYAQDPSTALLATKFNDNNVRESHFLRISVICHFNISEANEYISSLHVSSVGKLCEYLYKTEIDSFNRVDKIIFPSTFNKVNVLKRAKKLDNQSKVDVINNFVDDISSFDNTNKTTDFISIGTLEPRKNQEHALNIISELHKLGYRKKLTFVGDGPDRIKLERRAVDLGIREYITFAGYIENAKELLAHASFLIHTAIVENFPITLLEALSYGVPICATNVGGIPEIFDDTKEGVYLDLSDPKKSAKAIILLFDDEVYKKVSLNARKRYMHNFKTEMIAPVFLDAIMGE